MWVSEFSRTRTPSGVASFPEAESARALSVPPPAALAGMRIESGGTLPASAEVGAAAVDASWGGGTPADDDGRREEGCAPPIG